MPAFKSLKEFYLYYKEKNPTKLNYEQFEALTAFFPTLLLIYSDGIIDKQEAIYIDKLSISLSHLFREENLSEGALKALQAEFKTQLEYLLAHMEEWQETFLDTLKIHLTQKPENKDLIANAVEIFAIAAHKNKAEEVNMLQHIRERLELKDE
jgi:hypothetical protein